MKNSDRFSKEQLKKDKIYYKPVARDIEDFMTRDKSPVGDSTNIDAVSPLFGASLLLYAASKGYRKIMESCLKQGADPTLEGVEGSLEKMFKGKSAYDIVQEFKDAESKSLLDKYKKPPPSQASR